MQSGESPSDKGGQPGVLSAALSGLCPRCGAKCLFAAPAQFANTCSACGLNFLTLERGGRFVGVLTMLLALLLMLAALGLDVLLQPPLWLSLIVWTPLTVGVVIGGLRLYKTAWLYHQYERSIGE